MLKKFALGTSIAVFVTVTAHAAVVKEGSCGNNCAYQIEDNNGYVLTIRNTGENSDEFTMTSRTWNNSPYNSAPIKVVDRKSVV